MPRQCILYQPNVNSLFFPEIVKNRAKIITSKIKVQGTLIPSYLLKQASLKRVG